MRPYSVALIAALAALVACSDDIVVQPLKVSGYVATRVSGHDGIILNPETGFGYGNYRRWPLSLHHIEDVESGLDDFLRTGSTPAIARPERLYRRYLGVALGAPYIAIFLSCEPAEDRMNRECHTHVLYDPDAGTYQRID